jgi:two-component sensor histidine kinase
VGNNLQTVAALLRLQARRVQAPEARGALDEAVRRVGSIALVHETLSQSIDETVAFDEIADRLRLMVTDLGAADATVVTARRGSFGTLPGQVAASLAMILTELLQNATEHGFAGADGHLEVVVERGDGMLRVTVCDDGRGLPEGFDADRSSSLGLSIVRTLVGSELGGRLELRRRTGGGTEAEVVVPLA